MSAFRGRPFFLNFRPIERADFNEQGASLWDLENGLNIHSMSLSSCINKCKKYNKTPHKNQPRMIQKYMDHLS